MQKIISGRWAFPVGIVIGAAIGAAVVALTPLRDALLGTYVPVEDQALVDAATGLQGGVLGGRYTVAGGGRPEPLQARGVLIPVTVVLGGVTSKDLIAQVDTGAALTFIKNDVLKRMGAKAVGQTQVWAGPNNSGSISNVYDAEVWLLGKPNKIRAVAADLGKEDILLGRNVLANYRLTYDGVQGWAGIEPSSSLGAP